MTKAQMLQAMADLTGLNKSTIKDLMKHGWSFEQNLGQPDRFVKEGPRKR